MLQSMLTPRLLFKEKPFQLTLIRMAVVLTSSERPPEHRSVRTRVSVKEHKREFCVLAGDLFSYIKSYNTSLELPALASSHIQAAVQDPSLWI